MRLFVGWALPIMKRRLVVGGAHPTRIARLAVVLLAAFAWHAAVRADNLDALEQAAFRSAVERIAPAVVTIETIGSLERVGKTLLGTGPTTGLVVNPSGYIVSSSFNFIGKPSSILVKLPDGVRKPAEVVATDHARMLTLLKIKPDSPLPACEPAKTASLRVGQWTVAVGKTFDAARPNVAVGILSATDRVWGRAVQTDAAVSPYNYGGPLVDIRGRVIGVLAPLSPESDDAVAGAEWYDSGIGFAVPLEHVLKILPRWKKGEDLYPGRMGVTLTGPNQYTGEPVVAECLLKGPAATAGIKPGDRILEIDGRKIERTADIKQALGRCYAGDTVRFVVARGKQQLDFDVTLAVIADPAEPPLPAKESK
jgi:serine protease Do